MYKRSDKVAEAIQKIVSELLVKGLKDPRIGFVTITGVKVTDDLAHATIFFSVMGTNDERKASESGLSSSRGFVRKEIGRTLSLRHTPEVVFRYDDSIEYGNHIETLLKEIATKDDDDHS